MLATDQDEHRMVDENVTCSLFWKMNNYIIKNDLQKNNMFITQSICNETIKKFVTNLCVCFEKIPKDTMGVRPPILQ